MKHPTIATLSATLALALGGTALAQQQPPQPTTPQSPPTQQIDVGDEEVRKFAEIYVDIERTRAEVAQELSQAADQTEAQEIQGRAQDEIVTAIEEHGWSVEQFNQVANAINNDPELRQQAVDHIKEMGTS